MFVFVVLAGYDDKRKIRNIIFENLKINGALIYDTMPGKPSFYKTSDIANIFTGTCGRDPIYT